MDIKILLDILKFLWICFEVWKYGKDKEKEKAFVSSLENLNERLDKLENEIKRLKS